MVRVSILQTFLIRASWSFYRRCEQLGARIAVVGSSKSNVEAAAHFLATNRVMPVCFQCVLSPAVVTALQKASLWEVGSVDLLGRRLWTASECLQVMAPLVEANTMSPRNALDIGCAQGRECVWLALRGCWDCVCGIDVVSTKLERFKDLMTRHGVRFACRALLANVTKTGDEQIYLRGSNGFSLVHVSRCIVCVH